MKYVIRYAALAMAMLSGTAFLSGILRLLRASDFAQHRFAPVRVSRSETLFVGLTCVAFAGIYQLMVGSKSDSISKTQTEIDLAHVGFIGAWFCCLFMVHKMSLPAVMFRRGFGRLHLYRRLRHRRWIRDAEEALRTIGRITSW